MPKSCPHVGSRDFYCWVVPAGCEAKIAQGAKFDLEGMAAAWDGFAAAPTGSKRPWQA